MDTDAEQRRSNRRSHDERFDVERQNNFPARTKAFAMIRKFSFLIVFGALILAAPRLPAPIVEEPTPKLAAPRTTTESKTSLKKSEAAESGMNSRSVQVVLTPGTQAALAELRSYVQKIQSAPFSMGSTDVQPEEIIEKLRLTLSSRFNNISIGNNGSRNGLTLVFDLQAHVATYSGKKNTVSFVAIFKNGSGRTLQTISASGTSTMPYPAFATKFPQAVQQAFADFSQKLNTIR